MNIVTQNPKNEQPFTRRAMLEALLRAAGYRTTRNQTGFIQIVPARPMMAARSEARS